MDDRLLSLKWNNHKGSFTKAISLYRDQALYSDVTLACNGEYFHVHKIILSSCSEYFKEIFSITQCKQPVIVLKDIRTKDVEQLLQYIYMGEVEVKQYELAELIKAAECLKIKGLATPDEDDVVDEEIPKKKNRKRHLSSDTPESPKKKTTSITSNVNSDASVNFQTSHDASINFQTSQNTHNLNQSKEIIKIEPDDVDIIEGITTKFEIDKIEEKTVIFEDNNNPKYDNYEEKEIPYTENEPQNENLELSDTGTHIEYIPEYESEAGPSGMNEGSSFNKSSLIDESNTSQDSTPMDKEISKYCIKRKNENRTMNCCALCEFSTPHKTSFTRHVWEHIGQKPYTCQYCDYRAVRKFTVKQHQRVHTGEKPYACNQCPFRTSYKNRLLSHETSKH